MEKEKANWRSRTMEYASDWMMSNIYDIAVCAFISRLHAWRARAFISRLDGGGKDRWSWPPTLLLSGPWRSSEAKAAMQRG